MNIEEIKKYHCYKHNITWEAGSLGSAVCLECAKEIFNYQHNDEQNKKVSKKEMRCAYGNNSKKSRIL